MLSSESTHARRVGATNGKAALLLLFAAALPALAPAAAEAQEISMKDVEACACCKRIGRRSPSCWSPSNRIQDRAPIRSYGKSRATSAWR